MCINSRSVWPDLLLHLSHYRIRLREPRRVSFRWQRSAMSYKPFFWGSVGVALLIYTSVGGLRLPAAWLAEGTIKGVVGAVFSFLGGFLVIFVPLLVVSTFVFFLVRGRQP